MAAEIPPNTTGQIFIQVDDPDGFPIEDATITVDVYGPPSTLVSGDILMTHLGAGEYSMEVEPEWSVDAEGYPREGAFFALMQIDTPQGYRETVKFPWRCVFNA